MLDIHGYYRTVIYLPSEQSLKVIAVNRDRVRTDGRHGYGLRREMEKSGCKERREGN